MKEKQLHHAVCQYLKLQYPRVIFTSEQGGIPLTLWSKQKQWGMISYLHDTRSHHAHPDLWILCPNEKYFGLFIELKSETNSPFKKKDGSWKKNKDHEQAQAKCMKELNELGYYACFAIGMDDAILTIDNYMNNLL